MAAQKMREEKRKRKRVGSVESFPPKNFINEQKRSLYSVLYGAFIAKPPLQNTQKNKTNTITGGQIGKKTKNEQKLKGARKVNSGRGKAILQVAKFSQCCKNSQPTKFCSLRKFRSLAPFLLLSASLFFWFLICSYELNLDSPWLSTIPIYGIKILNKTCHKI